jgi:glycosyltransferase involved in cell wall biosynthesis
MKNDLPPKSLDVLFLLEGTYPYVRGGVSSWVNRLLHGFPDLHFGVIFLGSSRDDYDGQKYIITDNVLHYEEHFLDDAQNMHAPRHSHAAPDVEKIRAAHANFRRGPLSEASGIDMQNLVDSMGTTEEQFMHDRAVWNFFLESYQKIEDKPAFIDYFWTLRGMHSPLWLLKRIVENAPTAKIYHSASTGYAGYLGALLAYRQKGPLIISEHGIYTKERRIDLMLAQWINDKGRFLEKGDAISHIRELWIRFFEILARVAYQEARHIVSLYVGARELQIKDGAPLPKLSTIPNGVSVPTFSSARHAFSDTGNIIALIGRVVPIKDIKTYIRAVRLLADRDPDIRAWIVGPEEEDPDYFRECRLLIQHLRLDAQVQFLGYQSTVEILGSIRLSVLSSISEGLPLAVLESFAAGIPVIATDVGSCRELILGKSPEDREIGSAGEIVAIANPNALAASIQKVLYHREIWTEMSSAAIARVERFYQENHMFAAYQALYGLKGKDETWPE